MLQVMPHIASMGIYVVKADAMRKLLMEAYPNANDFGSEVIPGAVSQGMRVQAYLYEGYWEDIGTIGAFYNSQLALLNGTPPFSFYDKSAPIYTMSRFLPPSKFSVRHRPCCGMRLCGPSADQATLCTHCLSTIHACPMSCGSATPHTCFGPLACV